MYQSFIASLVRYSHWYLASLLPGRHPGAPLGPRRLLFLLLFPAFLAVQLLHWLALLLDEWLFPAYRQVRLRRPVFIAGLPRSGTTYLHRRLAADPSFTTVSAWEALLAPAICQRLLLRAAARLDRRYCNGAGGRLLVALLERMNGDFDSVHPIGPLDAEEDYLCLLPAGGCFLLLMAFPFAPYLEQVGRLQEMPPRQRRELLTVYHRLLQRHCYCHPGRRLLSKNAAFACWLPFLARRYPDAALILCVRDPATALASQLSSLRPARRLFATDPDGSETTARFTGLYRDFVHCLAALAGATDSDRLRVVEQDDLRRDPAALTAQLAAWLGIATPGAPDGEPRPGGHRYSAADFALDEAAVTRACADAYGALLRHPGRVGASP